MASEKNERATEVSAHGDRPWVYFMIDAFFLITQFFVITFKVKADEVVLPQRLPPGGTVPANQPALSTKQQINVHVMHIDGQPRYIIMNQQNTLAEFSDALASAAASGPEKYAVRVSYEASVPFGDIMGIFNACSKVKIQECGLIPIRAFDIPGGPPR